jgi:sugar phosphate isomerase/epimerase
MQSRFRIGNQTSRHVPWRLPYEFALEHSFGAFEWFSDTGPAGWSEGAVDGRARQALRREGETLGVRFSVHVPVAADPTRSEGVTAISRSLDFAGGVAAEVVNIHLFPERQAGEFAMAIRPLLANAPAGVRLCLENTPATSPEYVNKVFEELLSLPGAGGRVGMCLDTGHANLHASTRNDYLGYVDRLQSHVPVIHWHAHENWGDGDSHLPLFTGPSARDDNGLRGLTRRLWRRGFCGSIILEQWPQEPELLAVARDRLVELLQSSQAGPATGSNTAL